MAQAITTVKTVVVKIFRGAGASALVFIVLHALFFLPPAKSAEQKYAKGDTIFGLYRDCKIVEPKTNMETMNWVACRSYISGLRDGLLANGALRSNENVRAIGICGQPRDLPIEAYIQVFV